MLKKIFSIENNGNYKQITILGMQFKSKNIKFIHDRLEGLDKRISFPMFTHEFYPFEQMFPEGFYKDFCTKDITKRYINLMRGLDDKSKKLLNRVLFRIQQYAKNGQTILLLDKEEHDEVSKLISDMTNLVELPNGYQAINGYCFSGKIEAGAAVVHKHFIDEVVDKKKILENDIIDAGAHVGDSALVLSPYTKGKIHSFEPELNNFENLKKTIQLNNLENTVVPVKMGIGGEVRSGIITTGSSGANFIKDNTLDNDSSKEEVAITTIDKYVEENNIKVGLIKTDVEGFEQELLKGAMNTIKRDKPVLMISIYHTFDDFWDIKPMIESWDLGYTFKVRKPATLDFCGDLVLNAEVPVEEI